MFSASRSAARSFKPLNALLKLFLKLLLCSRHDFWNSLVAGAQETANRWDIARWTKENNMSVRTLWERRYSQDTLVAIALGQKMPIVGCDPKADSTHLILNSKAQEIQHLGASSVSVQGIELRGVSRQLPLVVNQLEDGSDEQPSWLLL